MWRKAVIGFWMVFVTTPVLYGQVVIATWTSNSGSRIASGGVEVNRFAEITREPGFDGSYSFFGSLNNELTTSGWTDGKDIKYWAVSLNTTGFKNVMLSSKHKGSVTGPRYFRLNYSIDGGKTWQDVEGSAYQVADDEYMTGVVNRLLPEEVGGQEEVILRWIMKSNTAISGFQVDAVGNSRIKEVMVTGEPTGPTLMVSPATISGLKVDIGYGPSLPQTIGLSGLLLDGSDVTISASEYFEVSDDDRTEYGNSVSIPAYNGLDHDIGVRLSGDLPAGRYEGELVIAGAGVSDVKVPIQGIVISPQSRVLPYSEEFDEDLGAFYVYNEMGPNREWEYGKDGYAVMDGFDTGELEMDWLILPGIDVTEAAYPVLSFESWYNYGLDDENNFLKLLYSTDYEGIGDPGYSEWNELHFVQPEKNALWKGSGDVSLSLIEGDKVYLAFLYMYDPLSYREWRVDRILIEDRIPRLLTADLTANGYAQTFSDFSDIYTLPDGWSVSDERYMGDWGTGTGAGLRGNAYVLGYQHTATTAVFAASLQLLNATGHIIKDLVISYSGMVTRDVSRFPEWVVEVNEEVIPSLYYSTSIGKDSLVQARIAGLSIPEGDTIRIRWLSDGNAPGSGARRQIGIGDVTVFTTIGMHQYQTMLTGNPGFRMLSTPVPVSFHELLAPIWTQGMTGSDDPYAKDGANVWTWKVSSSTGSYENWQPLTDLNTPIGTGEGMLAYVYAKDDKINGDEVDIPFNKMLSVTGSKLNLPLNLMANEEKGGFTLFGNPTTSPLTWKAITRNGLDDIVYVWDPDSEQWITGSIDGTGDLADGVIRPFQGFFVYTSEGGSGVGLEITEAALDTGGVFYGKKRNSLEPMAIRLQLEGENLNSSAWLHFSEDGQISKDAGDGLKLQPFSSGYALLATRTDTDMILDINHLPVPDQTLHIPLYIETTRIGNYTLSSNILNLPDNWSVMLTDRETGDSVRVDTLFRYPFELSGTSEPVGDPTEWMNKGNLTVKSDEKAYRFMLMVQPGQITDMLPSVSLPEKLNMKQNYPNPFNPFTSIQFELPERAFVKLAVYDLLGREVALLISEDKGPGMHQAYWDGSLSSSGIYLYRLEVNNKTITRRMTLMK
ncbi:MAG: T9SS type A sorting domain-containing protein [Balneolales bacterium]